MYKIIFSDIDRTLAIGGEISEQNIKAVKKFVSLGNKFILVSGRTIPYTVNISKKVGASNYIICNNGSIVYDYLNEKVIYKNVIKKQTLINMFNISKIYNARCIFGGLKTTYTNKLKYLDTETQVNEITDEIYDNNPITQFTISHENKDIMLKIICEIENLQDVYISNKCRSLYDNEFKNNKSIWIDISPCGTSKGIAIRKLLEHLNINLEESVRIGDDLNDLPMFLEDGLNVAVSNAINNLKQKADYVTDTCENSGVAKLIDKIINNHI